VCNPLINTSDNRLTKDQNNDQINEYDFDKNGNLTLDAANQRFVYDAENHLKEFFLGTNSTSTPDAVYSYDGEGKRVKKISSTEITVFVYDGGGQLVAEYSTQLATTPQVSYLTNDHLGSARVITNQLGQVTTRKDYAAFGEELGTSERTTNLKYDSSETRKGYTGYEKDDESGLDFAQARYYNTLHGRFTSVDPLTASATIKNPQTFNRYSYVLNSPYKFTDPLGLISSSTSACGQWCQGSGPYSNGYSSNYSAGGNATEAGLADDELEKLDKVINQERTETPSQPRAERNNDEINSSTESGSITISSVEIFEDPPGDIPVNESSIPRPGPKPVSSLDPRTSVDNDGKPTLPKTPVEVQAPKNIGSVTYYVRVTAVINGDAEFNVSQDSSMKTGVYLDEGANSVWKLSTFPASEQSVKIEVNKKEGTATITFAVKLNNRDGQNRPFAITFLGKSTQGKAYESFVGPRTDPISRIKLKILPNPMSNNDKSN
jgi:RHS repeat-associated protein